MCLKLLGIFLKKRKSKSYHYHVNLRWISNKTIIEFRNITKAETFKSFLHLSYKKTVTFFVAAFFNFFMKQTLTDDFGGLHKNVNCAFPLNSKYE